jgi:beta-N-acetylhexosaminidase
MHRSDVRSLVLRTLMPGFVGTSVPGWLGDHLADGLGSVCLYGPNVTGLEQLTGLCADLRVHSSRVVLAVDEEGGDVTRLHYRTGSPYAGNAVLGRIDDPDVTRAAAAAIAADLRSVGIDLDLAPVVDVNSSPDNPVIGVRSFGADPTLVARHTTAWVDGLQSGGVAACAKHFPGHGDTVTDSHLALPVVDASAEQLRARELVPFAAAVAAGTACVMTAAIVVPAFDAQNPATFSSALVRGVLREELGFTGVVVTDALDMAGASAETGIPEAAVRALAAGCDLLCLGSETTEELVAEVVAAIVDAVSEGRLALQRLEEAASSVDRLAAAARPVTDVGRAREVPLHEVFTLSDDARGWLARDGAVAVVQVETSSNLAVGHVPWGPASVGVTDEAPLDDESVRVALVGRDLVADHPAWTLATRHRAAGLDVIVVECGWPRGGADVVTWGGAPVVARALGDLLLGRTVSA